MSRVTIKEIARLSGVSPSTVSLVLNNKPGISKETRYRVLRVSGELNYTPNLVARSLVRRQSDAVGLMITNTKNPIFPEIGAGVEEVLNKHGLSLNLISTFDDVEIEKKKIEDMRGRGIDGLITSCALLRDAPLKNLVKEGFPVISALRRVYDCPEMDYVIVDNEKAGYLAVEHLVRLGHERIAVIMGPQNTSTGLERFQGALAALRDYGVELNNELVFEGDYFRECGYLATNSFLNLLYTLRPTAIFSCNDDMAMGAFEALLDAGLSVPEDMALVGLNNVEAASLRTIELTTIEQHSLEMGRLAAQRIIKKINHQEGCEEPYRLVLEPSLVIRRTCGFNQKGYVRKAVKI
jgi:LacI family transcriptional regulator